MSTYCVIPMQNPLDSCIQIHSKLSYLSIMTNLDDFLLDDRVFPLPSEAEVRIDADRLVYDLEY